MFEVNFVLEKEISTSVVLILFSTSRFEHFECEEGREDFLKFRFLGEIDFSMKELKVCVETKCDYTKRVMDDNYDISSHFNIIFCGFSILIY